MRMNTQQTPSTAVTVTQILDRYERDCMDDLAPRTQRDYRRHIGHLKARFGHLIAAELEPRTFADFLNIRRGKINRVRQLAVLSAALTIAIRRWFWLKTNALREIERPRSKPRTRLIGDDEFAAMKAMSPLRVRLAMDLALITGQRQGDILDFRWADITPLDEPIFDPVTKTMITDELNVCQSKTGKRIGIGVTKDLEAVLDRCWQLPERGEFILTRRCAGRYTSEGFRALWQRSINKYIRLGGAHFTFHDIRALCATKQPTPESAMRLLGHATLAMTLRVYRRGKERVTPTAISAAMAA